MIKFCRRDFSRRPHHRPNNQGRLSRLRSRSHPRSGPSPLYRGPVDRSDYIPREEIMPATTRNYEAMVIIKSIVPEETITGVIDKLTGILNSGGASLRE